MCALWPVWLWWSRSNMINSQLMINSRDNYFIVINNLNMKEVVTFGHVAWNEVIVLYVCSTKDEFCKQIYANMIFCTNKELYEKIWGNYFMYDIISLSNTILGGHPSIIHETKIGLDYETMYQNYCFSQLVRVLKMFKNKKMSSI